MNLFRLSLFALCLGHSISLLSQETADEGTKKTKATPPPFSEIRLQYHLALSEAKEPLDQLASFYESKLKELEVTHQKSGNLEGVLAAKKERESFHKIPTEVADERTELKKLQSIYLDAKTTRSAPFVTTARIATNNYVKQLEAQIIALTQKGNVEEALLTNEELLLTKVGLKRLNGKARDLGTANTSTAFGDNTPGWEKLKVIFEKEDFTVADTTAGQGGGGDYRDISPEPGILVGLQLQYSHFNNFETVRGVLPIFLTEKGKKEGEVIRGHKRGDPKRVIAKKGYAISEVEVFSDNTAIRRAKITFARINGDRLDLTDSYDSGWHGEYEKGAFSKTTSDGRFVVGTEGVCGLGIGKVRFLLGGKK